MERNMQRVDVKAEEAENSGAVQNYQRRLVEPPKTTPVDIEDSSSRSSGVSSLPVSGLEESQADTITTAPAENSFTAERAKMLAQRSADEADALLQTIWTGDTFTKYSKYNEKKKKVTCTDDGRLFWSDLDVQKALSYIKLVDVTSVVKGKTTDVLKKKKDAKAERCFSIVTTGRTLDLEASSAMVRDTWVKAIQIAVQNVVTLGTTNRGAVVTPEQVRHERELDCQIQDLQMHLQASKIKIEEKEKLIEQHRAGSERERCESQSQLLEKERALLEVRAEVEKLQAEQQELHQKLKRVHHERQASRTVRMNTLNVLQGQVHKIEESKREAEQQFQEEKRCMSHSLEEAHQLLGKAKETMHKRALSKQARLSQIEAYEREIAELRAKNQELRTEVAAAKTVEGKANMFMGRIKKMMAIVFGEHATFTADGDFDTCAAELDRAVEAWQSDSKQSTVVIAPSVSAKSVSADSVAVIDIAGPVVWQPDSASDHCVHCASKFTFVSRRHHCRKWYAFSQ